MKRNPSDYGLKFGAIPTCTPADYDALAAEVYALARNGTYTPREHNTAQRPTQPVPTRR